MKRLALVLLVTLPLFVRVGSGQSAVGSQNDRAGAGGTANRQLPTANHAVADLAWMTGHWSEGEVEELWLAPKGDLMLGMSRTVRANGKTSFEFIRIARTADGIFYIAQPGGRPPTSFRLVESKPGRVVFANPEHDFPKRIVYELRGEKLCARTDDGTDGEEWCWSRVTR